MDDPISALDANVRKKIFKKVFLEKFKDKTRVLVTHAVDFLHFVDTIILLKEGEIILKGSYNDLKESAYLKEVISIHKKGMDSEVKVKEEKKKQDEWQVYDSDNNEEDIE
jgi:ABC-type multidrug transport system ATPase subunit